MSRQRKVVITMTYNDLGIIVDTKTEELDLSAQPNLQLTCNQLATDLISRQAAIEVIRKWKRYETTEGLIDLINALPSAQPDHTADISKKVSNSCGHENDLISRQAAIELKPEFLNPNVNRETEEQTAIDRAYAKGWNSCNTHWIDEISDLPSVQPEIIRCKDCKYWQDQEEGIVEVPICARPQNKYEKFPLVMLIDGDGFCSYAERRTDETY